MMELSSTFFVVLQLFLQTHVTIMLCTGMVGLHNRGRVLAAVEHARPQVDAEAYLLPLHTRWCQQDRGGPAGLLLVSSRA